jgi:hypothetical protein
VGAAPHAREARRFRAAAAEAAIRLTGRGLFIAVSAAVFAFLLVMVVVRPAIERGGYGELAGVVALFLVIILAERWMRTR